MSKLNRRDFLKTTVAAGMLAGTVNAVPAAPAKKSATDWVTLGKSGVKVTRLAFGPGGEDLDHQLRGGVQLAIVLQRDS